MCCGGEMKTVPGDGGAALDVEAKESENLIEPRNGA
jgi:hypothetical protein